MNRYVSNGTDMNIFEMFGWEMDAAVFVKYDARSLSVPLFLLSIVQNCRRNDRVVSERWATHAVFAVDPNLSKSGKAPNT